jgi:site-specific recombinase XerD
MDLSKRRRKSVEQEDQETGQIVAHPAVAATTFEAALDAFLNAQNAEGHSKVTQEDYSRVLALFLRYMKDQRGHTNMQQITEGDIYDWLSHLRNNPNRLGKPHSTRTIETYSRSVVAFFNWLERHHYLAINPMAQVKLPKVERALIRVYTEDELERLDAACERDLVGRAFTRDERKALAACDRAVFWLLLSTGIRLSELCGLRFRDLDWDNGMIYVLGKGAKERKVPFGKVARQHLNTYIQYWRGEPTDPQEEHVFLNAFGNPLRSASVQERFRRLKRLAGIKDKRVSAHTCRHWFAVNAIKQGMPTAALRDLLGHETWAMMEVYVRLAEQDKRDIYTKFSPVDALGIHHSTKDKRVRVREWRNARKQGKKGGGSSS